MESCSGGLRPLVELCVEPAGLCGRCTGVSVPLRVVPSPTAKGCLRVVNCLVQIGVCTCAGLTAQNPTRCLIWQTEQLHFHFSLSCIGEGNGNPLQCSCLQNPRDGGAWWAAIYRVAQSRT